MSLNLAEKQAVVAEVAEVASASFSVVASEYRGMSVEQLTALRVKARQNGVYLRVVKNTLARRALQGTEFECIQPALAGPLILAFARSDPGAAARVLKDFAKDNDRLVVKAVAIGGQMLPATELDRVANLPTRDEALSLLLACMKAPLAKLVRTINEVPAKLVRTIEAVRLQREGA